MWKNIFVIVIAVILTGSLCFADKLIPQKYYPVILVFENDIFAQTDKGYTNGMALSISSPWYEKIEESKFDMLFDLATPFTLIKNNIERRRVSFAIGQSMFTPEDTSRLNLIPDEAPYAGLLFARVSIANKNSVTADAVGLVFGLVGPASLAEKTQKGVHAITNSEDPQGWVHQLKNEPIFNVNYRFKWKPYSAFIGKTTFKMEVMPYTGFSLGNLLTEAEVGMMFRIGDPVDSFGSAINLGGIQALPDIIDKPMNFSWFFFSGVEASYTAYTLLLDGNTFRKSHSVDRIPQTASLIGGLAMGWKRYRLGFYMSRRTRVFETQDGSYTYGSVTLGYLF